MKKIFLWLATCLLTACQAAPLTTALPTRLVATALASTTIRPMPSATPTASPTSTPTASAIPAPDPVTPTPPTFTLTPLRGDLWNQISRLEDSMPRTNSQGYRSPTIAEMAAFGDIAIALENGDATRSNDLATANGYELFQYTDRGDGNQESYLLRELKPIHRGWGLFAFRIGVSSPVIIEAPHPLADEETSLIAMRIYRALDARALLIAGAHRDANTDGAADVAHNASTVFQTIHQSLLVSDTVILQIHGFASAKHPGYPQVVLGHDQGAHSDLIQQLADALSAMGVRVGICEGNTWSDLCGETNVQSSVMIEGVFVHIEMDETVRANDQALLSALVGVFALR